MEVVTSDEGPGDMALPLRGQWLEGPAPAACWEGWSLGVRGLEPSGSSLLFGGPDLPQCWVPRFS